MVICEEYKFIFVHVYRTGGSSIDRAFSKWALPATQTHKKLEEVPNWEQYFSFGFVRNPWDRTLSGYMFQTKKGRTNKTFEQTVLELEPGKKEWAQYNMLKNCSYVGRFEHLEEDLKEVCEIVGIQMPNLPHIWKTDHKPYTEYYTEEMKQKVYDHQSGDVDHYGFTFGGTATKNIWTV